VIAFLLSLFLDGYISNFIPYSVSTLWCIPAFTFTIVLTFACLRKKMSLVDWGIIFVCGFLYDCFYTNYFFLHGIIFLVCASLLRFVMKRLKMNFFIESILFVFLLLINKILLFAFLKISSRFSISLFDCLLIFVKEILGSLILFHGQIWGFKKLVRTN